MVFVQVTGAEELIKFLEEISSPKKVEQVNFELAKRTAEIAFRLAPEDTGDMEKAITFHKNSKGEYEVTCEGIRYAVYNEFGTYKMPVGKENNPLAITSTSGKAAYRPFMRPAAYKVLDELNSIINSIYFGNIKSL